MSENTSPEPPNSGSKRFSIEKALAGNYTIIEFKYKNKKIENSEEQIFRAILVEVKERVYLSGIPGIPEPMEVPKENKRYRIITHIIDQDDRLSGRLNGDVIKEGNEYYAIGMANTSDEDYPGIVRTAIVQFIKQGVFFAWDSSNALTEEGVRTYERIKEDGEVKVEKLTFMKDGQEYRQFRLTKKLDK